MTKFNFNYKDYNLNNQLLTHNLLNFYLDRFFSDTILPLNKDNYIKLFVILEYESGPKALGTAFVIKFKHLTELKIALRDILRYKNDAYFNESLIKISFGYKFIDDSLVINDEPIIHTSDNPENINILTSYIVGYNLPNTTDLFKWGRIILNDNNKIVIEFMKDETIYNYVIIRNEDKNIVQIINPLNPNIIILEFTDLLTENVNNFNRICNTIEYVYKNNVLLTKFHIKDYKFIKPLNTLYFSNKINLITMDIETRTINNVMIPYSICYFDGQKSFSCYLSDFNSVDDMLKTCIKSLFISKYDDHLIYIHNLSKFDAVFLLRILAIISKENDTNISIVKRESSIITIDVEYKIDNQSTKHKLHFRDSLLTLTGSLRKLAQSFKVEDKSIFPYNFVNDSNIKLDYEGQVPQYKYFSDISIEQYQEYCKEFINDNWNLNMG